MKSYFGLIFVLALAGCYGDIYPKNYATALEVCKDNEGVKMVRANQFDFDVFCKNGAVFEHNKKFPQGS